jgi:hypothetical protein
VMMMMLLLHTTAEKYLREVIYLYIIGALYRVGGSGTMLHAGKLRVRFPMMSSDFFNLPDPSSRTMALGSTQPQTEISTRNLP